MLIYNVTTQVNWAAHEAWINWMKAVHIPNVMATGCFEKHQFVRVLETEETDGPIYAVQYYAATKEQYEQYIHVFAAQLRKEVKEKWGAEIAAFHSIMQVVN